MSDLFHESVEEEFILCALEVMEQARWHRFQVLTKRSLRLRELGRAAARGRTRDERPRAAMR
jgi:protein gp37